MHGAYVLDYGGLEAIRGRRMTEEEFRFKDTTKDTRLIEILRGNLALHRRRVKDYYRKKMMEEAVEECIAAIKVKNQLKDIGERV